MSDSAAWRLGRRPALDGLRGIAVLLVVVCHAFVFTGDTGIEGFGESGVQIFFVLSGFLITSLLLDELERDGSLNFRRFYARRARRLAPALLATVVFVAALAPILGPWWTTPRALLATLTWTTNWAAPSVTAGHALAHTWSLAIEEQFYLVWPLLLTGLVRLRWPILRGLMVAAVGLGVMWPFVNVTDWRWHLYYGTDMRALPLLSGALLAMLMRRRPEGRPSALTTPVAVAAIFVLAGTLDGAMRAQVEPSMVAGLTVAAIWGATQATRVPVLSSRVLGYVGRRSYALYLWHPIVGWLLVDAGMTNPIALAVVMVPTAFVLAELSWRYVEHPFAHATAHRAATSEGVTTRPTMVRSSYTPG